MIFYACVKGSFWPLTYRWLLIMKLAVFITLLSVMQAVAGSFAQTITLKAKNIPLAQVMRGIQKQSGHPFFLNGKDLADKKVEADFKNAPLDEAMTVLLKPLSLEWTLKDGTIVIKASQSSRLYQPKFVEMQPKSVIGRVTDEQGKPIERVTVLVKGTSVASSTDAQGNYQINMSSGGAVLVFTILGFETIEKAVGNQTTINVTMKESVSDLDEVVVVGYGTARKRDLTGAVASIKADEISQVPSSNMVQSLAGRASGVYVSQNTGSPGSPVSVRIRGTNSIKGSNEPLYVVDGFPYSGSPLLLNNADIESVEILKDASATAIYGSRGANGVVLITTKTGKSGKVKVDYDGYIGSQSLRKKLDLMNATEYANFYNEQAANDGLAPHFTADEVASFGEGTDWQDVVFRSAPIISNTVTISGGNDKTRFSVSGGNFNQKGIIVGSEYVRNSLRVNLNSDISDKLKFDFSGILSRFDENRKESEKGNRGGSLISAALSGYPTMALYNADGSYTNLTEAYTWGSNVIVNPLNFLHQESNKTKSDNVLANLSLSYEPIKGLIFKTLGGIENGNERTDIYRTTRFVNSTGSASISTPKVTSVLSENTVNYRRDFGKHNINALAGFTYQNYVATTFSASGTGFISDNQETYDIGAAATQNVPKSSYTKWSLISYLARVNYSFDNRFLATISFRTDGSSRYSEGQKWGYFPSAALAWRLSEEPFIKSIPVISDLKLRVGYGETGNTAIDPYFTLNQLVSSQVVFGDALVPAYSPSNRLAGPLKWETTAQTDIGIDLGLLNNRLSITADFYVKNTRDLLNNVTLPASQGYSFTVQNVGKIRNKGIDLNVTGEVLKGDFNWQLGGNISFNRNKVMELYSGNDILGSVIGAALSDNINILREGYPLGSFYGYVEDGYDANGYIIYKDFNDNGSRDQGDKQIIGDPNPDFTYGLTSSMSYKRFDLSIFVQGSKGNDIYNLSAQGQGYDYGQALNMLREVYTDHWTPTNTNAKYPVIKTNSQAQMSDRFVEDGSFLRVKNIQLAYNLPTDKWQLKWLSSGQVYISAQNLFTLTDYSWYDPEVNSYGGNNSIVLGIDHYVYPTAKTLTFGIKASF
ncbi:TonB-linked outer membrane protein, SusC/RagA family [Olivibacter domesticus]|uniref:TonB-linked outer membrane protein, SusC/RagA family n=2 Tax=Olivibacter domesticus TaxID=407022 RepID=A0A1H7SBR1_OLID1|nr:TonB-linked outer membrane protein, SusC/RagA family [Olivibacter domesticus]